MQVEPSVHVIDDDEDIRRSLRFLLTAHGLRADTYALASEFLHALKDGVDGCILSDVRMPGMDGIELLHSIRASGCDLPFVVMTGHADVPMAVRAMKEGALDFIEKPFDDGNLISLVQRALEASMALAANRERLGHSRERIARLTPRELQVLEAVAAGKPSKIIAHEFGLSTRTVEVHRANLIAKLGVDNAGAAAALFVEATGTSFK